MSVDVIGGTRPAGARTIDRRQFLLGGVMLTTAAAGHVLEPRRAATRIAPAALEAAVPMTIGRYRYSTANGIVTAPRDELTDRIYDVVLTRVYVADDAPPIMLLIAYGSAQDSGLQLHRPEVCYPAAGFAVRGERHVPMTLPGIGAASAVSLTAERGDRVEQLYFWTRIGDAFPATPWDEKMAIIRANLSGHLPDGILVRLSMIANEMGTALPDLKLFNTAMLSGLAQAGRRIILGPAAA